MSMNPVISIEIQHPHHDRRRATNMTGGLASWVKARGPCRPPSSGAPAHQRGLKRKAKRLNRCPSNGVYIDDAGTVRPAQPATRGAAL